jgi:hypothetical protein
MSTQSDVESELAALKSKSSTQAIEAPETPSPTGAAEETTPVEKGEQA